MRLIPALLTNNLDDYRRRLRLAVSFSDYAQVDFKDGVFASPASVSTADVSRANADLNVGAIALDAHLMVKDPVAHLVPLASTHHKSSFVRAFFHFEAVSDHRSVIDRIKSLGLKVGIAVNPKTGVDEFAEFIHMLDAILFLCVDPGIYGSPFQPSALRKLREFKISYPGVEAGVDGGVNLDNMYQVIAARPDFICVGGAIFDAPEPKAAFDEFSARVRTGGLNERA